MIKNLSEQEIRYKIAIEKEKIRSKKCNVKKCKEYSKIVSKNLTYGKDEWQIGRAHV